MGDLGAKDFQAYFEAVHGRAPFRWQARLSSEVARRGQWPDLLDLPTGAGKTAAIDVAVFHLALDAANAPAERRAPRRIVLVVDRRTVVDQAFERAKHIAEKLAGARDGVLKTVADRLRSLSGTGAPLALAQLRGGMPRDDAWAQRPDQPLVAVSTVDQAGSRLLFRGYGLSDGMRPIHAGLLGNDTLFLLDEVHLSRPFQATLRDIERYGARAEQRLPQRWQVVEMSATPGGEARDAFHLVDEDRGDAALVARLAARKPAALDEPVRQAAFAEKCAEHAAALATPGRVVGVVVNRVATARECFAALRRRRMDARLFLVTGRMRPLDRDDLDRALLPYARSGRTRDAAAPPVIVVSTQCIEAGADFDFDALVTECASLDALRQRFGRLNRLGEISDARGVVLARSESLGKDEDDPIYGTALKRTWEWLREAPRDFGIDAMAPSLPAGERLAELLVPADRAPVMLPAHLDLWVQTKPAPEPDPDVSLWLHGVERRQEADVQVVWRADLREALLRAAVDGDKEARDAALDRVEVCAPVGLEAIALPLHAVRAWLLSEDAPDMADVERSAAGDPSERRGDRKQAGRPALLWRGDESKVIGARELRPGMTIVVPATYGGIAEGAWDPASSAPVPDLGDRARWQQTGRPTLRLEAAVHPAWIALPKPVDLAADAETDDRKLVREWLDEAPDAVDDVAWLPRARAALARRPRVVRLDALSKDGEELASAYLAAIGRGRARDASTEGDGGSHTGVEVALDDHMKGVVHWARGFAERCGLPATIVRDVEIAGRWHDAGKVDPRFQRMLHGGSAFKAEVASRPLAKSRTVLADREARRRARELSGYPDGMRHELGSVALLEAHAPLLAEAGDRELVLHLVASHHGFCRPFAPAVEDREAVELALDTGGEMVRTSSNHGLARLDSGVPDRFFRLVERYGWFGLAWLEAILRLADHRRSQEEQEAKEGA